MLNENKGFYSLVFISCRLVQHGSYPVVGKDNSTFKDYMYIERAAVHKVGHPLCVVLSFLEISNIYTVNNKKTRKVVHYLIFKKFAGDNILCIPAT